MHKKIGNSVRFAKRSTYRLRYYITGCNIDLHVESDRSAK